VSARKDRAEGLRAFGAAIDLLNLLDDWEGILRLGDMSRDMPYELDELLDAADGSEMSYLEFAVMLETCITPWESADTIL
jgi:hypothetical protein